MKADPTNWVEFVLERFTYNYKSETVHCKSSYSEDGCGALITGSLGGNGYRMYYLCGKMRYVHHIVWVLISGDKPAGVLDHIDGNPDNNSHHNLRAVNQSTNMHNQVAKGYYWDKARERWIAQIKTNKKNKYLGQFATEQEARAAYVAAKKLYGFIHR